MYKRNRKLHQARKINNKIRTLTTFMLKGCFGVKYDLDGISKVKHAIRLALDHFIRKENKYE